MKESGIISRIAGGNLKVRYYLLALFVAVPLLFFAQNDTDSLVPFGTSSQYIEKKDTLINFKVALYNIDQRFEIKGDDFHFKIRPNFTLKTKFYFNYRFLSFAVAFAPHFIPGNSDEDLKGKSKTFTLNVNIITNHWVQDLHYNYIKGFYLSNTADFEPPDWEEGVDPYIQFPAIRVHFIRGATSYKINKNFSLKAVRTQTELQKRSAGSFMPSLLYSYYFIDNNSDDPNQQSSQKSHNFDVLASIWYMHTFVIKKVFYISLGLAPSGGYSYTWFDTRMGNEHEINHYHEPVFKLNEQAGIGVNLNRFFTGAVLIASQTMENQGDNPIREQYRYMTFNVFIGYRFGAPKFLRRTFDKIEGIIK